MSDAMTLQPPEGPQNEAPQAPMQYLVTLLLVAAAGLLAAAFERLVSRENLTLFFVLPVVISATSFGWGPALTASVAGVLTFDFFFTEPRFSLAIASPADICDAALLLVIATIVSAVAADSRRKAMEARRAADQAEALRSLAHAVVEARPAGEIARAAAGALNRIFRAPAVILSAADGRIELLAKRDASQLGEADEDAARVSAASHVPTRAGVYPADAARFDFWPVAAGSSPGLVIGVDFSASKDERPPMTDRFIEMVGGYLAASRQSASAAAS